jgi:hypothetical protein
MFIILSDLTKHRQFFLIADLFFQPAFAKVSAGKVPERTNVAAI